MITMFGPDLVYRPMDGGWVGQLDQSSDRAIRSGVTDAEFTDFNERTGIDATRAFALLPSLAESGGTRAS
jgi:hypothetical protein